MISRSFFALMVTIHVCTAGFGQQSVNGLELDAQKNLKIVNAGREEIAVTTPVPLFSYQVGGEWFSSANNSAAVETLTGAQDTLGTDLRLSVEFKNVSGDTVVLHNVLPFSTKHSEAFITGKGNHELSRTYLFVQGKQPVNVIVPDNAWELGFNVLTLNSNVRISALSRRDKTSVQKGTRKRFETILYPGGSVKYDIYVTTYSGAWQNGLTKTFQERKLYDVAAFNDTLFKRKDLQWIRHTYVLHLMDAWDKYYYDYTRKRYTLEEFIKKGKTLYGGDDVVAIWPTWPTLGLDQRNQFDLFHDLPGGTAAMKKMATMARSNGTRFFICYNPWDGSTRKEDHFSGLARLIAETSADGVILDTKGESSRELQDAADKVRSGVVMYSEGMAVPKDMQGIVSGRVHNALEHPPMLNLNKLIKPDFAIYRVTEINKGRVSREFATSFFNGYGTEINIMAAGEPDGLDQQYRMLGRTSRILRENTFNFTSNNYTPLINCMADSIWVNRWQTKEKTLYTIFSLRPEGYKNKLFAVQPDTAFHYVDIWHHKMINPYENNNQQWIEAETDAFNAADLGSENEGAVDCIAKLPKLLQAHRYGNNLSVSSPKGGEIRIWAGDPGYEKKPLILKPGNHQLEINKVFGRFEGDLVIQLMNNGILMDETIVTIPTGSPRRISRVAHTRRSTAVPGEMVVIPTGKFTFKTTHGDEFIGYPTQDADSVFQMPSYLMDRFPVTNGRFKKFIDATRYVPADTANFLKHWKNGRYPEGQKDFPVVYVSYEDAQAFAKWEGKRLPTEIEWQYAAQTSDGREWPWKQQTPVTRKEEVVNSTLTVTSLQGIDSSRCNLGNGAPYAVGSFPTGAGAFGLMDLVGCVWQLTNDVYETASHRYIIMKGGSYFKPSSSWWYVQGGPRELHYRQFLLRVSNGFERNATVGFRCLADK